MHDDSSYCTMPFGKHKGRRIDELSDAYLAWLSGLYDLRPRLRAAVADERARRASCRRPVSAVAEEIVTSGFRAVSMRCHPDRGGTHEEMIAAIAAADWLRQQVRGLGA